MIAATPYAKRNESHADSTAANHHKYALRRSTRAAKDFCDGCS